MRGTRGMGECYIPGNVTKHSGGCCQAFWGMSTNIPGNILKYSGECPQTLWGMLPNIPGNVAKHSGECRKTFRGMSSNILRNVLKYFGECCQTFREMSTNIPGNVAEHSGECPQTFPECRQTNFNSQISTSYLRNLRKQRGVFFDLNLTSLYLKSVWKMKNLKWTSIKMFLREFCTLDKTLM